MHAISQVMRDESYSFERVLREPGAMTTSHSRGDSLTKRGRQRNTEGPKPRQVSMPH